MKNVDFNNRVVLGGEVHGTYFDGEVDFQDSRFNGESYLMNNRFNKTIFFSNATFNKNIHFDASQFNGYADFFIVTFKENAMFPNVLFNDNVSFQGAHFLENANFGGSKFKGAANFSQAEFKSVLDLRNASFDRELNFNDVYFSNLIVNWNSIKDSLVSGSFTYQGLIKNFKDRGQYEDARNCYYQYRLYQMNSRRSIDLYYIYDYLAWLSCGYGVRPDFVGFWSILLVMICASAFFLGDGIHSSKAPQLKKCLGQISRHPQPRIKFRKMAHKKRSKKEAFYFSLLVFFHSPGREDFRVSGNYRYLVVIEDLFGWFLQGIFFIVLLNVWSTW
jgi:hypothetical protein